MENSELPKIFLDQVPLPYQSLDKDGKIIEVNQTWLDVLGYTRSEVIGHWFGDFLAPESLEPFKINFPKFKASGKTHVELAMTQKDGSPVIIKFSGKIGRDSKGNFLQTHCFFQDITTIKKDENDLRKSEMHYRDLFEDSPISLWEEDFSAVKQHIETLKKEGIKDFRTYFKEHPEVVTKLGGLVRILDVNKAALTLIQAKDKKELFENLTKVFGVNNSHDFATELINIAEGKIKFEWEGVNYKLNGEPIIISLGWSAALGFEETLSKVFVSVIDITDRKKAEQALMQSEISYRNLAENLPDIVTRFNNKNQFIFINKVASLLTGLSRNDFIDKKIDEVDLPKDLAAAWKNGLADVFKSKKTVTLNYDAYFPEGIRIFESRFLPEFSDTGEVESILSIHREMTASEAAKKELQEKDRQVSTLMANLTGMAYRCKNDKDWTMEFASEGCLTLTGYNSDDFVSNKIFFNDIIVAEDQKPVYDKIQDSIKNNIPYRFNYRIRAKNGEIKWLWDQGRAILGANNEILALEGYITDISETMRANQNLQLANERFKLAALAANLGVWEWDIETNQLFWDDRMYELYGVTRKNFTHVYEDWSLLIHPEDRNKRKIAIARAVKGEQEYDTTFRIILPDHSIRFMKAFGQVTRSTQGKPQRMTGVNFDITDIVLLQNAERVMVDTQTMITHCEDENEIYQIIGKKTQELIGNGIVAISRVDIKAQGIRLTDVFSPEDVISKLVKKFKINPYNFSFNFKDMTEQDLAIYKTGKLERYRGGLHQLSLKKIPQNVSSAIEKLFKISGIYTIGFNQDELYFGGLTILAIQDISPFTEMIATIANQAAIAIKRLRAEKALRESEEKFRRVFKESPIGICLSDVNNQFTSVNDSLVKMLGYFEEELLKLSFKEITYHEDVAASFKEMKKLTDGEISSFTIEKRYVRKNGSIMWGKVSVSALRNVDGSIITFLAMVEDIDKRKRTEQALEKEQNQMEVLMDSTEDSVYFKDLQNRFVRANRGTAVKMGLTNPEEILGKTDFDFFPKEVAQSYFDEELEIIKTGKPVIGTEEIEIWANRPPTWVSTTKIPVKDENGKIVGTFGISRNITDRKLKEEEIKRLNADLEKKVELRTKELNLKNQELESFTYTVSHDLKAPLRGISGYSGLLLQDHADQLDEEGKSFLNKLILSVDNLRQLIDDLLSYSHLERKSITMTDLAVEDVMKTVLNERNQEITQENVKINLNLEREMIHSSPELMTQILQNFLDNALKFSSRVQAPEIWIDYKNQGETSLFTIRDNGVGFEMTYKDKIFDVFQRLHHEEDYPGTGIGLALVKKAVEMLNYRVWAEGTLNEGATFFLEINK